MFLICCFVVMTIFSFTFAQYFNEPSFEDETRFTTVLSNTRLKGHIIATKKILIEVECLYESSRHKGSGSVNYNANNQTCEINMVVRGVIKEKDLIKMPGWTYFEKDHEKVFNNSGGVFFLQQGLCLFEKKTELFKDLGHTRMKN